LRSKLGPTHQTTCQCRCRVQSAIPQTSPL
jgi:hypothetical protein